jgi:hypothetical protein
MRSGIIRLGPKGASVDSFGVSARDAIVALQRLREAAAELPDINVREVAKMRMAMLLDDHGLWCVFVGSWWRWLLICAKE